MGIIVEVGQGGGAVSLFSLNFRGRVGILRCGLVDGGGCFLNFVVMEVFFIFISQEGWCCGLLAFFFGTRNFHVSIVRFWRPCSAFGLN